MRIHLVLDVTRDDGEDSPRVPGQDVMDELDNELEANGLEVNGVTFSIRVEGIGKTRGDLDESMKLRRLMKRS